MNLLQREARQQPQRRSQGRGFSAPARLRHLPPVAVPLHAGDLWQGVRAVLAPAPARAHFRDQLCAYTGANNCTLTSSGRAALTIILLTLRRLSPRRTVIVAAYSCPTVAQAVLAAGLTPLFCDLSPQSLAPDSRQVEALIAAEPLALVVSYLYGLAHSIDDLLEAAHARGVYVVEDAAQALGATVSGQMAGTKGDFGLFSLGRGKALPAGHGGVLLSQRRYAAEVAETITRLRVPEPKRGLGGLAGFLGYGLATTPAAWWFVARSRLNPADAGMDVAALPPIELTEQAGVPAGIGSSLLSRLERTVAGWRQNATRLRSLLAPYEWVLIPSVPTGAEPSYLRFPLVVDGERRAQALFRRLSAAGIGVSRSYTHTLPELFAEKLARAPESYPGASRLARSLLTLPTHHYLEERDLATIARIFAQVDQDQEN